MKTVYPSISAVAEHLEIVARGYEHNAISDAQTKRQQAHWRGFVQGIRLAGGMLSDASLLSDASVVNYTPDNDALETVIEAAKAHVLDLRSRASKAREEFGALPVADTLYDAYKSAADCIEHDIQLLRKETRTPGTPSLTLQATGFSSSRGHVEEVTFTGADGDRLRLSTDSLELLGRPAQVRIERV